MTVILVESIQKEENEPTEGEIEYVAHQCTKILETKENYAILTQIA